MATYPGTGNLRVIAGATNYNAHLLSFLTSEARTGDSIVDFGAGLGIFAAGMKAAGHPVRCVEPADEHFEHLEELGLGPVRDLSEIEDASADFIFTLNVLEHIDDDNKVLRQLHSKLASGGRLLVYVPAFQVLYSSHDRSVGHYRRYHMQELAEQASRAGFSVRHVRYVDSLGFLAALLYRLIGNRDGQLDARSIRIYDRFVFPLSRFCDRVASHWIGKNLLLIADKR